MQSVPAAPAVQPPVVAAPTGAQSSQEPKARRKRYASTLYRLGIVEIVLGSLCCILCIACIAVAASMGARYYYRHYHPLVYISPGLWCGVFTVVSGILGVKTRQNASVCMFNANMALSILSASFMVILFIFAIITAVVVDFGTIVGIQSVLCVVSFISFVISTIHSAYCCGGVCCVSRNSPGQVIYVAGQTVGQQYVQLPNGQYMLVQNQPVPGQVYPPGSFPSGVAQGPVAGQVYPMAPGTVVQGAPVAGVVQYPGAYAPQYTGTVVPPPHMSVVPDQSGKVMAMQQPQEPTEPTSHATTPNVNMP